MKNAKMMGRIFSMAALSLAFIVAACGDDSSSGAQSESSKGSSLDDLDKCTKSLYGEVVYVEDEKAYFECSKEEKDWVKIDSTKHEAKSSSSKKSSKESSSSAGKKDSKESSSSSVKKDSKESSSSSVKKDSKESSSSTEKIVVKSKSISGVSQKGPFVKGSTVNVYELDSSLAQTGKSFTGKINSDDGKFSVKSVSLTNKYALLEANGYFRNEITGEKSKSPITLYALTDLSEREKVNVNLLTHLEYERTLYLVNEKGKSVAEAKKQAESEIFKAFGIEGKFGSSEDLDIFSTGDGNSALLAISVMLLRDLSEADLTEELTKFALDIEEDGSWDDESLFFTIAKWAKEKDLSGELGSVYSNVANWKLGSYPQGFEKYIRNFWYAYYELDECNKGNEGKVMDSEIDYSVTDRFICKSGAWVYASELEKDTYQWEPGVDGEVRTGDVLANNHYMYYEPYGRWDYMFSFDIPKEYHLNPDVTYGEMTDSRDKKKYKTVTIGEGEKAQTWMAENLNYEVKNSSMCYDDLSKNCDVSGRLYTWYAAVNKQVWEIKKGSGVSDEIVQGVCPKGWHLPTKAELDVLIENVGGELSSAGKKLKAKSGWNYRYNDHGDVYGEYDPSNLEKGAGTDDFGFSALATGYGSKETIYDDYGNIIARTDEYGSYGISSDAYFWSSSDKGAYYKLENISDYFSYTDCDTPYNHCEEWADYNLAAVRCVKDK